jgi:hypothetical protein
MSRKIALVAASLFIAACNFPSPNPPPPDTSCDVTATYQRNLVAHDASGAAVAQFHFDQTEHGTCAADVQLSIENITDAELTIEYHATIALNAVSYTIEGVEDVPAHSSVDAGTISSNPIRVDLAAIDLTVTATGSTTTPPPPSPPGGDPCAAVTPVEGSFPLYDGYGNWIATATLSQQFHAGCSPPAGPVDLVIQNVTGVSLAWSYELQVTDSSGQYHAYDGWVSLPPGTQYDAGIVMTIDGRVDQAVVRMVAR